MIDATTETNRLLIVEDNLQHINVLRDMLSVGPYAVEAVSGAAAATACLGRQTYGVVLIDVGLPNNEAGEVLRLCQEITPKPAFLVLGRFGPDEEIARAFGLSAKDFLAKPVRQPDLLAAIERTLEAAHAHSEARFLRRRAGRDAGTDPFAILVGGSACLQRQIDLARVLAESDMPILIRGESGSGKEMMAEAIHLTSPRRLRPLVTAFLPGIQESLLLSELFGHGRRAFTGADNERQGLFKEADQGTIFLDEIGDATLELQKALLRAIDKGFIRPVGVNLEVQVNVRVIAATHRNLKSEIEAKRFREDLFYRLGGDAIVMPPLRERREDIPALVQQLIRRGARGEKDGVDAGVLELLTAYDWPGNVRELKSVLERAACLARRGPIQCEHIRMQLFGANPGQDFAGGQSEGSEPAELLDVVWPEALESFKRRYFQRLADQCGGDAVQMAERSGMHVQSVRKVLRFLRLDRDNTASPPNA